jgi:citrate lyase subunit beta/citryl-CoA lyase
VFTPSAGQLEWAQTVLDAFDGAGGEAIKLPDGEFIDLPVADRARALLGLANRAADRRGVAEAHRPQ